MQNGLKIKRYVKSNVTKDILVVKETIKFNISDLQSRYISNFNSLIANQKLLTSDFKSNSWIAINDLGESSKLNFKFETQPEINTALKCYIILKLFDQSTSPANAHKALYSISKVLISSNFFNNEYLENMRYEIKTWKQYQQADIVFVREFLNFYSLPTCAAYIDLFKSIPSVRSKQRNLPSYKSIINFDYLIKDFISNGLMKKHFEFVPIIIWWELTKIIPMRPIELGILKKDCLFTKNNSYFIKIERRKDKNGTVKYQTVDILQEFEIDLQLYNLIKYYIDETSAIKSIFLFPPKNSNSSSSQIKRVFMGMDNLRQLLIKFYATIIDGYYKYEVILKEDFEMDLNKFQIERIQLGDTRHIAFCSMMLQGFNPLTIAQIGGHSTVSQQLSYCDHLKSFVDSHTFMLTKSLSNKIIKKTSTKLSQISKKEIAIRENLGDKFYLYPRVSGGRCMNENFPIGCNSDDHIYCKHFIADETASVGSLIENLHIIDHEIQNKIKFIAIYTKSLLDSSNSSKKFETDLKTNTNMLNTLIKKKAILKTWELYLKEEQNE